jgi:drug/metabolite transporter (DMT)-like permease
VPPEALALALGAAVLHALWNLVVARDQDIYAALAVAFVLGSLLVIPFALARWRVEPEALPFIVVSAALETAYLLLLGWAYRRADMSLVYPVARGLAPVLVLVVGSLLLGQHVSQLSAAGVIVVGCGVLLVRGIRAPARWSDVALAACVAVCIMGYQVVDQQGLRYADPASYLLLVAGTPGILVLGWILAHGGAPRIRRALRPSLLAAGGFGMAAYGMVLVAFTLAPAALVAAVRESSVVIATGLAALVLHERVEPVRWLGVLVVVAGVSLVGLG